MVTDFIYDNHRLSDFGYAVVSFEGSVNGEKNTDSQISFNHISIMNGKRQPYITAKYEKPLEMEFYIAKNSCIETVTSVENTHNISPSEMAFLKRWLVRTTAHKLKLTSSEYNGVYWMGSFNLEEYVFGDKRIGAHLTFECDAPFGYMDEVTVYGDAEPNNPFYFNCASDEIGYIYPHMEIVVLEDGDLEIENTADNRTMIIKNCQRNEMITIDKNLQISSSIQSHDIYDDFNYVYYRVTNSFPDRENSVDSNLSISFSIIYSPYSKVVAV